MKNFFFVITDHPQRDILLIPLARAFARHGVVPLNVEEYDGKGNLVVWGWLRGQLQCMEKCRRNGYSYIYLDNGFFKTPSYREKIFRFSFNERLYSREFRKDVPKDRLKKMNPVFLDYDYKGEYNVIYTPSPFVQLHDCLNTPLWIEECRKRLKEKNSLETIIKRKFHDSDVEIVMEKVECAVSYNSMVNLDYIMKGKRAIYLNDDFPFNRYLCTFENYDFHPDREFFFSNLAMLQYNIEEIERGEFLDFLQMYGISQEDLNNM